MIPKNQCPIQLVPWCCSSHRTCLNAVKRHRESIGHRIESQGCAVGSEENGCVAVENPVLNGNNVFRCWRK